jgi:PAS domain S-box-containing protein
MRNWRRKPASHSNIYPRLQSLLVPKNKKIPVGTLIEHYAYNEAIVDSVTSPLVILDKALRVKTVNSAFFATFKTNQQNVYDKQLFRLNGGEWNIPQLKKMLQDIIPKHSFFTNYEVVHDFKGSLGEKILLVSAQTVTLGGYTTELILFTIQDVTKQRKLEEKLQWSYRRSSAILESINEAFIAYDKKWNYTYINKEAEKILGKKRSELLGKNARKMFPDAFNASIGKKYLKTMKSTKPLYIEEYYKKHKKWFSISIYPTIDGLVTYFYDITARKNAEQLLKESDKKYRMLADAVPDIVWIISPAGKTQYINKQWTTYSGRVSNGNPLMSDVVHPQDKALCLEEWEAFKKNTHRFEGTYRLRRYDGEYRWFLCRIIAIRNQQKKLIHWLGTATDIHDQKMAEEKKNEFISIASHELKTPLTTISGYGQILLKRLTQGKDKQNLYFVNNILNQVKKIDVLINDLLDSRKIQAGLLVLEKKEFDLTNLVREIVVDFQYMTETHQIQIAGVIKTKVLADRERIGQVIMNFLTNAIKYSPKSNKIIVTLKETKGYGMVSVRDFGMGIAKIDQQRIFEPFYRVREKGIKGYGLGLYISSEIIRRHGGKISIKSVPTKGSVFSFVLPLEKRQQ